MTTPTLVERIEKMANDLADGRIEQLSRKSEIVADVQELVATLDSIVFDADVVGGRWLSTIERARKILSKCGVKAS